MFAVIVVGFIYLPFLSINYPVLACCCGSCHTFYSYGMGPWSNVLTLYDSLDPTGITEGSLRASHFFAILLYHMLKRALFFTINPLMGLLKSSVAGISRNSPCGVNFICNKATFML